MKAGVFDKLRSWLQKHAGVVGAHEDDLAPVKEAFASPAASHTAPPQDSKPIVDQSAHQAQQVRREDPQCSCTPDEQLRCPC